MKLWFIILLFITAFPNAFAQTSWVKTIKCADSSWRLVRRGESVGCVGPNGRRQGLWHKKDGDTVVAQHTYQDGIRNGPYTKFLPQGRPSVSGQFLAGEPHGTWKLYDETGRLNQQETYESGKLNGPFYRWYPNCL